MSLAAYRWAWRQCGLTPSQRLTLLNLADRVNSDETTCFPSISSIRDQTGQKRDTILASLHWLESAALISIERGRPGQGNRYVLHLDEFIGSGDVRTHKPVPKKGPVMAAEGAPEQLKAVPKRGLVEDTESSPQLGTSPPKGTGPQKGTTQSLNGDSNQSLKGDTNRPINQPITDHSISANSRISVALRPPEISEETAREWLEHRRRKKSPATQAAFDRAMLAAESAARELKIPADRIVHECIDAGWTGIKVEWLKNRLRGNGNGNGQTQEPSRAARVFHQFVDGSLHAAPDDPDFLEHDPSPVDR